MEHILPIISHFPSPMLVVAASLPTIFGVAAAAKQTIPGDVPIREILWL
jgi:hypothetical protein